MHFEDMSWFIDYCFTQQKTNKIDTYIASDWRYDQSKDIAECKLINTFFDTVHTVTIECQGESNYNTLVNTCNQRYITQFDYRFQAFFKPTAKLIAVYQDWNAFKKSWLIRGNQNLAKKSVPILIDIRKAKPNRTDLLVSFYIQPSNEIYKFGIADVTEQDVSDIKADLTTIVRQAYV